MAFSSEKNSGPQHEVTLSRGDEFIVYIQSIPLDDEETSKYTYTEGGRLVFNGKPWTWDSQTAPSGDYLVGIIAEDMDGNHYEAYTEIYAE
jgi:hypothetical protein